MDVEIYPSSYWGGTSISGGVELWHPGLTDLQYEELWTLEVHLREADPRVYLDTFASGEDIFAAIIGVQVRKINGILSELTITADYISQAV